MTIRAIESFDLVSSTTLNDGSGRWVRPAGGASGTFSLVTGRTGNCARIVQVNNVSAFLERVIDSQAEWYVGFAFRFSAAYIATHNFVRFVDGSTLQCEVSVDSSRRIVISRNGTVLATSTVTLNTNQWYYVEVHAVINNTTGVLDVHLDETSIVSVTGANTRGGTNNSADRIQIGDGAANGTATNIDFDDMYIADGTSSQTFLGDRAVKVTAPTGAGATTAWTPSTGANWAAVDEQPANDDTDYVSSATVNQVDTYAFADLGANVGAIDAVNVVLRARKDDAGTRQVAPVARPGSTDRVGATKTLSTTYQLVDNLWLTNPDTSSAWTRTAFNASEFGVKEIA